MTLGMTFLILVVLRIIFYPFTVEQEVYDLDESDVLMDGDCIRFFVEGNMMICTLKGRMVLQGFNYQGKRFVKFRTCRFLYNKETYRVVLVSVPYEEAKAKVFS